MCCCARRVQQMMWRGKSVGHFTPWMSVLRSTRAAEAILDGCRDRVGMGMVVDEKQEISAVNNSSCLFEPMLISGFEYTTRRQTKRRCDQIGRAHV